MLRRPTRSEELRLKLYPAQMDRYRTAAELEGLPVSEWVREVLTARAMAVMSGAGLDPASPRYSASGAPTASPTPPPNGPAEAR